MGIAVRFASVHFLKGRCKDMQVHMDGACEKVSWRLSIRDWILMLHTVEGERFRKHERQGESKMD